MRQFFPLLLIILLALAACDGSRTVREVGVISSYGDTEEVILAPDTVQAGETFTVTVQTFGDGCVDADDMEVAITSDLAVLTPYDLIIIPGRNVACPQIEKRPEHNAQVVFEEPGSATLRVKGMLRDATNTDGIMTTIEKTITVE